MCGWSHRERRGNERNACSCLFSKPFSNRPHTPKLHRSPSVTSNACLTSNGYLPAAVSLPEWLRGGLKIHCTQVRMGSNPIADTCGWRHTERKETKGTRGLPERHAFWLETERKETKGTRGLPERHAFS